MLSLAALPLPEAAQQPDHVAEGPRHRPRGELEDGAPRRPFGVSFPTRSRPAEWREAAGISLTLLAKRILVPTEEGDDIRAKREAILQPRIAREFLVKYDGKPLPRDEIARNVLVEMGVPRDASSRCLEVILDNAKEVGVLRTIKGVMYVDVQSTVRLPGHESQQIVPAAQQGPDGTPATAPTNAEAGSAVRKVRPKQSRDATAAPESAETRVRTGVGVAAERSETEGGPLRRNLRVDAYQLENRLGSGFSAEVWSAKVVAVPEGVDIQAGQMVAIKFYHLHALALPDQVLRVEREYRLAQRIRHPNLIRMYEFMLSSSRPHHNFLVMDLAKGASLKSLIPPSGLSVQKALAIARQILQAVSELHEAGALHRDIKPGNISVAEDAGTVHAMLLDLGIINVMHERGVTAASHFVGSKHWAPYEQLVGDPIDQRTDIYSVGAVLYNMLTGSEPYRDKGTEAAVAVEMNRRPLSLPTGLSLPDGVLKLVNSCLSTDPAQRPGSAKECLAILSQSV